MSAKKIAISILSLANPIIEVYEAGHEIFKRVAESMQAVENEGALKGDAKKATVIDYVKSIIHDMKADWSTWQYLVSEFIEKIIKIYNALTKK